MTTIYLIRHAEAEGNVYRRIHGWYDSLVTENGFLQIKALEERFRDITVDAVWSSDRYRTMTTARAIYVPKGLELHTDPELREFHVGDWEDRTWGDFAKEDPEGLKRYSDSDFTWSAPNGERLGDVALRLDRAIRRIAGMYPDKTVAIFSHSDVMRQFFAHVKGLTEEQRKKGGHSDNTAVTKMLFDGERFHLELERDNSHLDESISTLTAMIQRRKANGRNINLWFRPIDWATERDLYIAARSDAWHNTHVNGPVFEPHGFLRDAEAHLAQSPWGVTMAFDRDEWVGIVQLDQERYAKDNAGYIPFCYVDYTRRDQHLGVQLIGQAVSHFRPMGRDKLRLRCAPYNHHAQHFYAKYGFVKIGEEQGSRVPLDILEKYIGYDR